MRRLLGIGALALAAMLLVGLALGAANLSVLRASDFPAPLHESALAAADHVRLNEKSQRKFDADAVPLFLATPAGSSVAPPLDRARTDTSDVQPQPIPRITVAPRPYEALTLYLRAPSNAVNREPPRVLIVLHGVGGRGESFSQGLMADAERNNWLLVAPTLPYRNWMDPTALLNEDIRFAAMLVDLLDHLPQKTGLKLKRQAFVYGFSRGAQLAHRLALFYPERVQAVAANSAGTFTLPNEHKNNDKTAHLLLLPYGVGDMDRHLGNPLNRDALKRVSFLIQVGANDNTPGDVPRQFDPYVGTNRVERALAFQKALLVSGVQARVIVFPGTGHEMSGEMRLNAMQFLHHDDRARNLD